MSYCIGAKRHQLKPNLKICSQDDVSRAEKGVESYKVSMDTRCFCSGRFQTLFPVDRWDVRDIKVTDIRSPLVFLTQTSSVSGVLIQASEVPEPSEIEQNCRVCFSENFPYLSQVSRAFMSPQKFKDECANILQQGNTSFT